MMVVKKQLQVLWEILYHVKGIRGRAKWDELGHQSRGLVRLMQGWERVATNCTYPEGINKWDLMEEGGYGPNFWRTYSKLLEEQVVVDAIRIAKGKFYEKRRKEDRRKYSEYLARLYELLEMKNMGHLLKVF